MHGLTCYQRLFGRKQSGWKGENGFLSATLPIKKGGAEENPSLHVSLIDGHYRCSGGPVMG